VRASKGKFQCVRAKRKLVRSLRQVLDLGWKAESRRDKYRRGDWGAKGRASVQMLAMRTWEQAKLRPRAGYLVTMRDVAGGRAETKYENALVESEIAERALRFELKRGYFRRTILFPRSGKLARGGAKSRN
jgi:hypothetical protein